MGRSAVRNDNAGLERGGKENTADERPTICRIAVSKRTKCKDVTWLGSRGNQIRRSSCGGCPQPS